MSDFKNALLRSNAGGRPSTKSNNDLWCFQDTSMIVASFFELTSSCDASTAAAYNFGGGGGLMKPQEISAKNYLDSSFTDVIYEPIDGEAPDFLCEGRIAVEAQQLNQHFAQGDQGLEALRSDEITLSRTLAKTLAEYSNRGIDETWYVNHEFSRPLPQRRTVENFMRESLTSFLNSPQPRSNFVFKTENLKITLQPRTKDDNKVFVLGGWVDYDAGGFIEAELIKNIEICVLVKAQKIQKNKPSYPEWWLVLTDTIGEALVKPDMSSALDFQRVRGEFSKIILINHDGTRHVEI